MTQTEPFSVLRSYIAVNSFKNESEFNGDYEFVKSTTKIHYNPNIKNWEFRIIRWFLDQEEMMKIGARGKVRGERGVPWLRKRKLRRRMRDCEVAPVASRRRIGVKLTTTEIDRRNQFLLVRLRFYFLVRVLHLFSTWCFYLIFLRWWQINFSKKKGKEKVG